MRAARCRYKGQLTVYLSLMLPILISFLLALSESAWVQVARGEAYSVSTMAMDSIFGEYQKELLEEMDMFFLDGSYRTDVFSEEKILARYREYVSYETDMGKDLSGIGTPVDWNIELQSAEIQAMEMATDNSGAAVREQISNYMQEKLGLQIAQELTGTDEKLQEQTEALEEAEEEYQWESEEVRVDTQGNEEAQRLSPVDDVERLQGESILTQVFGYHYNLSKNRVTLSTLASHRDLQNGFGTSTWDKERDEVLDQVLFRSYLIDKLSCYGEERDCEDGFAYELEYLYAGKSSDQENLKAVLNRLLLVRMAENFLYLITDAEKMQQAESLAVLISTVLLQPELSTAFQAAIVSAWAYGESIMDLRTLTVGGEVAILKTAENWQLPLSSLMGVAGRSPREGEDPSGSGLDYREWVAILLYMRNLDTETMRFIDVSEFRVRAAMGEDSFRMDHCVAGLSIAEKWKLPRQVTCDYLLSYGYQ